ncbi:MAG: hypothetical protein ACREUF_05005, partial [Solimonas sp.]
SCRRRRLIAGRHQPICKSDTKILKTHYFLFDIFFVSLKNTAMANAIPTTPTRLETQHVRTTG